MVGINIGDIFTDAPWGADKIDMCLEEARSTEYFNCDAVKFWHCDPTKIIPVASKDSIRKVCVGVLYCLYCMILFDQGVF